MSRFRDNAELIEELRALRPAPSAEFATALDARAAVGFPRRSPFAGSRLGDLVTRLRALPPRRVIAPAGATALAAIVVATAVIAVNEPASERTTLSGGSAASEPPERLAKLPERASAVPATAEPLSSTAAGDSALSFNGSARYSKGVRLLPTRSRAVERSAEIVLATDPSRITEDAAAVFDAVRAHNGIVMRSTIRDGAQAGAEFILLIPSGKLGDAMASFSRIAEVRSRREATADITAPTVGVAELVRDSRARIDGLLAQLAAADTEGEREAAETELRAERRRLTALRSRLDGLQRRANYSRVSLRIETANASGSAGWGIGDALGDAGQILAVAAGVTLIGLAILAPLAALALLAWLTRRAWLRWSRRQALS